MINCYFTNTLLLMGMEKFMKRAIELAVKAEKKNEVPIGAVAVLKDKIIAEGFNERESLQDPLKHAEITVIQKCAKLLNSWRLEHVTLYVTVEPCIMCAGAILQSRIPKLIYGCTEPKSGAVHSHYSLLTDGKTNHRVTVTAGILETECRDLLQHFFKRLRK